jgi:hypothetical protein
LRRRNDRPKSGAICHCRALGASIVAPVSGSTMNCCPAGLGTVYAVEWIAVIILVGTNHTDRHLRYVHSPHRRAKGRVPPALGEADEDDADRRPTIAATTQ